MDKVYLIKYRYEDDNDNHFRSVRVARTLEKAKEIFENLYNEEIQAIERRNRNDEPEAIEKTDMFFEVYDLDYFCRIEIEEVEVE